MIIDINKKRREKLEKEAETWLKAYGYTPGEQSWEFLMKCTIDRILARKKAERMLDRLAESNCDATI